MLVGACSILSPIRQTSSAHTSAPEFQVLAIASVAINRTLVYGSLTLVLRSGG